MKWTVLIGILGVAVGYLLGTGREVVGGDEVGAPEVVRRDHRWQLAEEISKKKGLKASLGQVEHARLAKWILELEARAFPDALVVLKGLDDGMDGDPIAAKAPNRGYLTLGMARWYELEGESVLRWVLTQPEALRGEDQSLLLGDLIQDGYGREPTLSFQLLKKYAEVMAKANGGEGLSISWRYQLGRWSKNLMSEFAMLEELEDTFGWSDDDISPPGRGIRDPELSLISGLLEAGRVDDARELFAEGAGMGMELLEENLEQARTLKIRKEGWKSLKGAMEKGEVEVSGYLMGEVFSGWVLDDSNAAITWFLDREIEGMDRSEQIRKAAFSGAFVNEREGGGLNDLDTDGILKFLIQKQGEGEPVGESFSDLMMSFGSSSDWDGVEKLKSRVTPEVWEEGLVKVRSAAVKVEKLFFGEGQMLLLMEFKEDGRGLVERFGIQDEVSEEMARVNEESVKALMRRVGVGGE